MKVIQFLVGQMANFTYILVDEETGEALVIDPSWDLREDILYIKEKLLETRIYNQYTQPF